MLRPLAVVLLAALPGCAGDAPANPGPPPAIHGAQLVVREARAVHPLYREGSVGFLRIVDEHGIVLRKGRARTAAPGTTRRIFRRFLLPGTYTVVGYQRPCDGNCGYLDPPTERCRTTVEIRDGEAARLTLEVTPGAGCRVRGA
jgi:hypothetical protein